MLDLAQPRDLSGILNETFRLYREYWRVFPLIAVAVVVPMDIITLGFIDGNLSSGYDDNDELYGGGIAYAVVSSLVTTPLIAAAHVYAVMVIGRGEQPSAGSSLSHASGVFLPVMAATALYFLAVLLGIVALIIPGIYLAIRLYFAPQAVVAEKKGPIDALRRSGELVHGMWWRVFGIAIVLALVVAILGALLGVPVTALADSTESGPLLVLGAIIADTVTLSFAALSGTILYFDLRARRDRGLGAASPPAPPPPPPPPMERPEAPPGT
jgi:hypothetical protein